jgi:hypothetical protein
MWKTWLGIRAGVVSYENDRPHAGLPIDDIIRLTWKEKENVPPIAAPRIGGPLVFWASALAGLQPTLKAFGELLTDNDGAPAPNFGAVEFRATARISALSHSPAPGESKKPKKGR